VAIRFRFCHTIAGDVAGCTNDILDDDWGAQFVGELVRENARYDVRCRTCGKT
jgi:hypothetical protein